MRVLVTGASGWVGSEVTKDLLKHGHTVLGLARSEEAAAKIRAFGGEVLKGELTDLDLVQRAVRECDGVIHCGFNHDFSKFAENCANDGRTIRAMGEALDGTQKPLVVTSGTALVSGPTLAVETDRANNPHNPRIATEQAVDAVVAKGVRAMLVRLPPTVHGHGEHGFVPMLIQLARDKKFAGYVGEGDNVWAAVHRDDAAMVYVLALEKGAAGDRFHAVDEEGVPMREIEGVIGRRLGVPSGAVPDPAAYYGWFQHFGSLSNRTSSKLTREKLGWTPKGAKLLADLDHENYFRS